MASDKGVFTSIYSDKMWSQGSGSGSHPDNTLPYREFLKTFMYKNRISSVVDLGCGDWQSSRFIDWRNVSYLGIDVVDSIVQANVKNYQTENVSFTCLDFMSEPLPIAELVIMKDVLQHWPNNRVQKLLQRLSQYDYTLITNTREAYESKSGHPTGPRLNSDIELGGMRPIDLSLLPFKWPVTEVFRHISHRQTMGMEEIKTTVLLTKTI